MGVYANPTKKAGNYSWIGTTPAQGSQEFPKSKAATGSSGSITRGVKQSDKSWDKGTTGVSADVSYGSIHSNRGK